MGRKPTFRIDVENRLRDRAIKFEEQVTELQATNLKLSQEVEHLTLIVSHNPELMTRQMRSDGTIGESQAVYEIEEIDGKDEQISDLTATNLKLVEALKNSRCKNLDCHNGWLYETNLRSGMKFKAGECPDCANRSALIGEVEG